MKRIALLFILPLAGSPLLAQDYKVTTNQTDSFSVALVEVLRCAADRFTGCAGDSLRSTWLMGDDYKLSIPFPGSAMAIVRKRDWDRNVYVEFRGFADKKSREQGIRKLVAKIKKALGDQLLDPYENQTEKEIYFYGLSLKDKNGYFSMNMELFGSTTSAPLYLLGSEREDDRQPKQDFILLKIYPGVPAYYHYIREAAAPDIKLDATVRQLIQAAVIDFDSMSKPDKGVIKKQKRRDTLVLHENSVVMNYRGSNYSATLRFPGPADTVAFEEKWLYYQQVLQAALGSEYVYHLYNLQGQPYVLYFSTADGDNKPRIYLEQEIKNNQPSYITIKIASGFSHPTKAYMNLDDF